MTQGFVFYAELDHQFFDDDQVDYIMNSLGPTCVIGTNLDSKRIDVTFNVDARNVSYAAISGILSLTNCLAQGFDVNSNDIVTIEVRPEDEFYA